MCTENKGARVCARVSDLHVNGAVSVAEAQETRCTEAVLEVHLARPDRRGRAAGTHREASVSSLCRSIFIPLVDPESVPFLAGAAVEDSNRGVRGPRQPASRVGRLAAALTLPVQATKLRWGNTDTSIKTEQQPDNQYGAVLNTG